MGFSGRLRWDDQKLPILKLYFLPRLELYAESYDEYCLRRDIYVHFGKELPRKLSKTEQWNEIDDFLNAI